jgi:hypothetical protein
VSMGFAVAIYPIFLRSIRSYPQLEKNYGDS